MRGIFRIMKILGSFCRKFDGFYRHTNYGFFFANFRIFKDFFRLAFLRGIFLYFLRISWIF